MSRSLQWVNNFAYLAIGASLTGTIAVYIDVGYSTTDQAVSILALWTTLIATAFVGRSAASRKIQVQMGAGLDWIIIAGVYVLSLLPILRVSNYTGADDQQQALLYTTAIFVTAALFRVHVELVGYGRLLGGFVSAAIISPVAYLWYARAQLSEIATLERRFTTGGLHPNLIGFCCLGFVFFSITAYLLSSSRLRIAFLFSAFASLYFTYLASSRGSLGGIAASGIVALFLYIIYEYRQILRGSIRAVPRLYFAIALSLLVLALLVLQVGNILNVEIINRAVEHLEIFSQARGFDSGLTGRIDTWNILFSSYNAADFWLGLGPRKSSAMIGDIDNGYIVVVLENGILAGFAILARMLYVLVMLGRLIATVRNDSEYFYTALLICFLVAFFANNVVARYFWGIGNPTSLFAILIFAIGPSARWIFAGGDSRKLGDSAGIKVHRPIAPVRVK